MHQKQKSRAQIMRYKLQIIRLNYALYAKSLIMCLRENYVFLCVRIIT